LHPRATDQDDIEQISATQIPTDHHQGLGAVVRGLGGLGIGSLIGAGTGRDVAMVAGAIGGALIGNEVQKKHDQPIAGQQIIVRLSSGVLVQITQPVGPAIWVGQRRSCRCDTSVAVKVVCRSPIAARTREKL
jgi:outer membrane lipoprotein SlyB